MIMTPIGLLAYLGLCALIGHIGRDKKFGFIGNFFLSLFLSPLVGFVIWLFEADKVTTTTTEVVKS